MKKQYVKVIPARGAPGFYRVTGGGTSLKVAGKSQALRIAGARRRVLAKRADRIRRA